MLQVDGVEPVNEEYGLYQGTPIARHYIDRYMAEATPQLRGRVLEFGWPTYASHTTCSCEIFDIDRGNPRATIHGDICDEEVCRRWAEQFDAIICTTVLQLVDDPARAVENMRLMLRPAGELILIEKTLSRIDPWSGDVDRWRFTPQGLKWLVRQFSDVRLHTFGNVYAVCAYTLGLPAHQIDPAKLAYVDVQHPIVAVAHARK